MILWTFWKTKSKKKSKNRFLFQKLVSLLKIKSPPKNEKNSGVARVYSGKTKVEIIRKNSKNIDEDYNVNVFRNKLNLQEKPVTAPNVSRGQYKIMSKEKGRQIIGWRLVNRFSITIIKFTWRNRIISIDCEKGQFCIVFFYMTTKKRLIIH